MVFPKKSEYAHRESMPLYAHDNDPGTDYYIKLTVLSALAQTNNILFKQMT